MPDEQPRDLLDLYLYHIGTSEVPTQFHFWACLSMISACVGDRVWVQTNAVNRVYPNLYVFLIGPSGSGKEKAISTAHKLVVEALGAVKAHYVANRRDESMVDKLLSCYSGMSTKQNILEYLVLGAKMDKVTRVRKSTRSKFYFVTEELANSLNTPALAHELVKLMTALFVPSPAPMMEGTRVNGFVELSNICPNWLAGTTDEWLLECIPKTSIEGGFFARVCSVRGRRNYRQRCPQIIYPDDYDEVREEIRRRVESLLWLEGGYTLSDEARRYHDEWYMGRPEPQESVMEPAFNRADEMVYKLSLLLAIASWQGTFDSEGNVFGHEPLIELNHLQEAIHIWDNLAAEMPGTIRMANASTQSKDVDRLAEVISHYKQIMRSDLMRIVSSRGLNAERLDKALTTLIEGEEIKAHTEQLPGATKPRRWYEWVGEEEE